MIYTGLELGAFFEIPFSSPCHQILRGVNPLLQMIFTFMQMYFIFMNARVSHGRSGRGAAENEVESIDYPLQFTNTVEDT